MYGSASIFNENTYCSFICRQCVGVILTSLFYMTEFEAVQQLFYLFHVAFVPASWVVSDAGEELHASSDCFQQGKQWSSADCSGCLCLSPVAS